MTLYTAVLVGYRAYLFSYAALLAGDLVQPEKRKMQSTEEMGASKKVSTFVHVLFINCCTIILLHFCLTSLSPVRLFRGENVLYPSLVRAQRLGQQLYRADDG